MIKKDRIYVEDLRVKGTIGIFDWEKKIKQEISLSYEIDHDNFSASKEDKIEATTDYKTITKKIISFIEENKFELVETFAEKIAEMAGLDIPENTEFIIVPEDGWGPENLFSGEKLSVVMALYKASDIDHAIELTRNH